MSALLESLVLSRVGAHLRGLGKAGALRSGGTVAEGEAAGSPEPAFAYGDPVWLALPNPHPGPLTTTAAEIHVPALFVEPIGKTEALVIGLNSNREMRKPLAKLTPRKTGEIAPGKRAPGPSSAPGAQEPMGGGL